ncbi:MAG: response regulator [Ignavibacteriales bacterium]|nr:response regulator [Ignavibacteriales bacterium]
MSKVVLLVDDDEDNRELVKFVISRSRLDIELVIAVNGQESIDLIKIKRPDLILMDMQMPVMDGYAAVSVIKGDPMFHTIPIIAFTAQARPEDIARTRSIGCVEQYTKPMDPEELLNTIQRYIGS